jgi:hypothetical protein
MRVSRGARVRQAFRRAQVTFAKSAAQAHQAPGDGRPEIAYVHMRGTRVVCVRARLSVLPFSLSRAGALARALSRSLVLPLSFSLSRALSVDCVRACVRPCACPSIFPSDRWPYAPRIWARDRFSGRSNVGKSSLLNAVCSIHGLARTSKVPWMSLMLSIFFVKFLNDVSS